jgi:hypothetical protein
VVDGSVCRSVTGRDSAVGLTDVGGSVVGEVLAAAALTGVPGSEADEESAADSSKGVQGLEVGEKSAGGVGSTAATVLVGSNLQRAAVSPRTV